MFYIIFYLGNENETEKEYLKKFKYTFWKYIIEEQKQQVIYTSNKTTFRNKYFNNIIPQRMLYVVTYNSNKYFLYAVKRYLLFSSTSVELCYNNKKCRKI